jgi:hypothetical protein
MRDQAEQVHGACVFRRMLEQIEAHAARRLGAACRKIENRLAQRCRFHGVNIARLNRQWIGWVRLAALNRPARLRARSA